MLKNIWKIAMAKVLINGVSAKSGGGRSILTNFLTCLKLNGSKNEYITVVPSANLYTQFSSNVTIIPMWFLSQLVFLPFVNAFVLPYLIKKHNIDIVFNVSDVPIPTSKHQVFLFDWPYAAYPESCAWTLLDFKGMVVRKAKLYLFKKYLPYVNKLIAQNSALQERLELLYEIEGISIIPNAVSSESLNNELKFDFGFVEGLKLLCLTCYYPHKNLEIFIPLAKLIRDRGLDIKIILTISKEQGRNAECLLEEIKNNFLSDIIINIGPVSMDRVPSLYEQTDGLLLPTLLESFSGTYVEAMYHKKPIYTSNLDFAISVCHDSAYYFDPFDPDDILKKILNSRIDLEELHVKTEIGYSIMDDLPSWNQAFVMYEEVFCNEKDLIA